MKKITEEEAMFMARSQVWNHISSLQSELEALDGWKGFVPDWSKAPDTADRVDICWASGHYREGFHSIPRPLPPKVTRERTNHELIRELLKSGVVSGEVVHELSIDTLKALCTAAGIELTTKEQS